MEGAYRLDLEAGTHDAGYIQRPRTERCLSILDHKARLAWVKLLSGHILRVGTRRSRPTTSA